MNSQNWEVLLESCVITMPSCGKTYHPLDFSSELGIGINGFKENASQCNKNDDNKDDDRSKILLRWYVQPQIYYSYDIGAV